MRLFGKNRNRVDGKTNIPELVKDALRDADSRYEAFIIASNTGAWEYHKDNGYLWCSPEYFSMLGRDIGDYDFSGKPNLKETWIDLLHPEDRDRAQKYFADYLKKPQELYEQHFRLLHSDGHWVWVWSRGRQLRDKNGKYTDLTVGTHIDISDLKDVENALLESEERIRTLNNSLISGMIYQIVIDKDGSRRFTYLSNAVKDMYGCTAEEAMRDFTLIYNRVHPDDRQLLAKAEEEALRGFCALRIEIRMIGPTGRIRWSSFVSSPRKLQNGSVCWDGIEFDITRRKEIESALRESEARIRTLNNNLVSGMIYQVVVKRDGSRWLTYVSDTVQKMYGCTALQAMEDLGRIYSRIHPDDMQRLARMEEEAINNRATFSCEARIIDPSGRIRWSQFVSSPRVMEDGALCFDGIEFDITDRKKIDGLLEFNAQRTQALLQLNQMSGATMKEITDFALEEAVRLTGSKIGYLAFLNDEETILNMYSWSKSAMEECAIGDKPLIYQVNATGLWGEAIRQRRPIITNDYEAPNPWKKGFPKGHVKLKRHMNVPVFSGDRIVIVAGVGNKADEYDDGDVQQLTLLMEGMWRLVERKKVQDALLASEKKLSIMFDSNPTGIVLIEARTRKIVRVNKKAAEMIGLATGEIEGNVCHGFICPAERGRCPICDLGQDVDRSERVLLGKGESPIPIIKTVVKTEIGGEEYLLESFIDITERKIAEQKLKESEEKFRAIFNSTFQFTGLMRTDATLIEVNRASLDFAGVEREDVVNRPFWDTPWWSGDEDRVKKLKESVKRAAAGEFIRYEVELSGRGSHRDMFDFSIKPVCDDNGKVVMLVPEARDKTELKRTEFALKEAQHIAHVGSWVLDLRTNEIVFSEEMCNIYGLDPAKKSLSLPEFEKFLLPYDWLRLNEIIQKTVETRGSYEIELNIVRSDGVRRVIFSRAQVKCEGGEPVLLLGTSQDITDRKKYELELREKIHDLEIFQKATVGREEKMIELKDEIKRLRAELEKKV